MRTNKTLIAAFILAAITISAATAPKAEAQKRPVETVVPIRSPKVPSKIVFAGDTVRFDTSDMYERMDKEIMSYEFSHMNTMLALKRSERYFDIVVPILTLYGIPEDLKYLMVVETNLEPKAVSGAGAAGLWQFMKATGKEYGLVIDDEVDERFNIEKETVAACSYLKAAYKRFGNWIDVAASYNAGPGGISKKMTEQRRKKSTELWMAEETSRYIFRLLAVKMLFSDPAAFGYDIKADEYYKYYPPKEVVNTSGSIESLVDFAEEHGVSYRQLKEANLWLRDNTLENRSGHAYSIIIPSDGKR